MERLPCHLEQSYGEVLTLWQRDPEFRTHFLTLLAEQPYTAFRWETPAVTRVTLDQPFAFVTLDSPWLERDSDPLAFAEHFSPTEPAVAFPNLSGDSTLIVPCPTSHPATYAHLAAFVRYAPEEQQHALLALMGKTIEAQLSDTPLWLSTAGAGVAWLHVRLDKRPKYYGYAPYTVENS
ncbi:DUF6940 family protein [Armatimonas rosea]|uniref:Uncharacterized protein n=1 Tax=Armatimonas rosea TaxID=685828 RepID=A0A7W9SPA8_ARMRO|nr:hypothetical protein [Armatimonas rosea]MBB6050285.1 hypothetical protein [Armatimonas rosea]